ncbi:MAG TPA: substrate-binding domain-containing protein [Steroidobacteraceae bacterium]|jgi:inositol transport system substrate-binding protein|nr:substrate-binding domain-containing protein [Steroidobacteraceae bacterium]
MNRRIERGHLICAVLMLCLGTGAGCSSKSAHDRPLIVASLHNVSEPFFIAVRRELENEAAKLDVEMSVVDGQSNSAKQTADVEAAMASGAGGIILAPTNVNALAPAVESVLKAAIPIVTLDRRVDNTSISVPHVGADNVGGGRIMAQWVIEHFPNGAHIVLISGQPGSSSAIDRTRGIQDAFKSAGPQYKIVAEQSANWQREQGLTVTQNILTSLGTQVPEVVLCEDDDMALGALEALRSSGISGVNVLGFNATPEALARVRDGQLAATVEQSPARQARAALQQLVAKIRVHTPIPGASITPVLITQANIAEAERFSEVH